MPAASVKMKSATSRAERFIAGRTLSRLSDADTFYMKSASPFDSDQLQRQLARNLSRLARKAAERSIMQGTTTHRLIRTEITPEMTLTIRGLDTSDADKLEETAELIRRLIESADKPGG